MRQKGAEDVAQFFGRVDNHFRQLEDSHPQDLQPVTDARAALFGSDTAERRREVQAWGDSLVRQVYRRMEGLLFTAGISSDEIRHKIQDEKVADRAAAFRMALDQERILEKKKVTAVKALNALKDNDEEEPADEELPSLNAVLAFDPEDEEDLAWCNAMRTKYRLPLKKKTFAP